jgi:hypothetical protein
MPKYFYIKLDLILDLIGFQLLLIEITYRLKVKIICKNL